MRPSLQPIALSPAKLAQFSDIVYDFQIIQQPKNTRESVAKKIYSVSREIKAEKLYKRLLNPHPILRLSIYGKNEGSEELIDLTSHIVSQFFVHVTLVDKLGNPLQGSSQYFTPKTARQKSNFLIGTTWTSGTFYTIKEINKTVIIFKLDDLGVVRDGFFKLKFDLFEFKYFNSLNRSKNVNFLASVISNPIVIFKANEYYKESNQRVIKSQIQQEISNAGKNPIIKYLKTIKVIKYDDLDVIQKNPKESRTEAQDNQNNMSSHAYETPSSENDPLEIGDSLEYILNFRVTDSSLNGLPEFSFSSFANSSLSANDNHEDGFNMPRPSSSSSSSSLLSMNSNASNFSNNQVQVNVPSLNDLNTHSYFKSKSSTSRRNSTEGGFLLSDCAASNTSLHQACFDSYHVTSGKNKLSSKKFASNSKNSHNNVKKNTSGNSQNNNNSNLKKLTDNELINSLERHFSSNTELNQADMTSFNNFLNVEEYCSDTDSENSCRKTPSILEVSLDKFDGNLLELNLLSPSSNTESARLTTYSSNSTSSPPSSSALDSFFSSAKRSDHLQNPDMKFPFQTSGAHYNFNEFLVIPKNEKDSQQNSISFSTEKCEIQDSEEEDLLTPVITPTITVFQHETLDGFDVSPEMMIPVQFEYLQDNILEKFNNNDNNYSDAIQEELLFLEDKNTEFDVLL